MNYSCPYLKIRNRSSERLSKLLCHISNKASQMPMECSEVGIVVQSLSHVRISVTTWTAACHASLFIISQSLLRLMSIEWVMPFNHLILLSSLLLPSVFPSVRSFSMIQLFISGGRSIGASASVFPMNIQIVPVVIRESSALYSLCQQIIACMLLQTVLINHTELIRQ